MLAEICPVCPRLSEVLPVGNGVPVVALALFSPLQLMAVSKLRFQEYSLNLSTNHKCLPSGCELYTKGWM